MAKGKSFGDIVKSVLSEQTIEEKVEVGGGATGTAHGVDPDGGIGPKTLAAVNAFDANQLVEDYAKRRLSFLMDLQTWDTFGKGWGRRVAEVQKTGLDMA
jgi:lysozyme family protein